MKKELILLAGLHKTATTSIQRSCVVNRASLGKAGLVYPVLRMGGRLEANHTSLLNHMFKSEPHRMGLQGQLSMDHMLARPQDREVLIAQFARQLEQASSVLLVAEGVSVMREDELRVMRSWFEDRGWSIRVQCHVRHISPWVRSMVAQRVNGALRMTIAGAIEEFRADNSIVRRRIENLQSVFPDAEFHSHENALLGPLGPVGAFLARTGLATLGEIEVVRANEGASDCATRVMSVLNERFGLHLPSGAPNPAVFADREVLKALRHLGEGKFMLRPREIEPVLPLLLAENQWLREKFGEAFFDAAMQFPPTRTQWHSQSLAQLNRALHAMPPDVRLWMKENLPRIGIRIAAPQ